MSAQDLTNDEVLHHTEAFVTAGTAENRALSASATAAVYLPLLRAAREALSQPLGSGNGCGSRPELTGSAWYMA